MFSNKYNFRVYKSLVNRCASVSGIDFSIRYENKKQIVEMCLILAPEPVNIDPFIMKITEETNKGKQTVDIQSCIASNTHILSCDVSLLAFLKFPLNNLNYTYILLE